MINDRTCVTRVTRSTIQLHYLCKPEKRCMYFISRQPATWLPPQSSMSGSGQHQPCKKHTAQSSRVKTQHCNSRLGKDSTADLQAFVMVWANARLKELICCTVTLDHSQGCCNNMLAHQWLAYYVSVTRHLHLVRF